MKHNTSSLNLQIITFIISDTLYGFDIRLIKEVTPPVPLTTVPLKTPEIRGVTAIRGCIVLVMDIRVIIDGEKMPFTGNKQIIIIRNAEEIKALIGSAIKPSDRLVEEKPVGFLVDAVEDILTVNVSDIEETPSHLDDHTKLFVDGIIRKKRPIILLNPFELAGFQ